MHRVIIFTVSGARRKYFCATDDGEWLYAALRANPPKKAVRLELWYNEDKLKACNIKRKSKRA